MMSKGILGGEFSSGIVRPLFPAVSLMTLALSVWVRFVAGRIDGVLARLGLVPTAGYVEPVVDPSVLRGILLGSFLSFRRSCLNAPLIIKGLYCATGWLERQALYFSSVR